MMASSSPVQQRGHDPRVRRSSIRTRITQRAALITLISRSRVGAGIGEKVGTCPKNILEKVGGKGPSCHLRGEEHHHEVLVLVPTRGVRMASEPPASAAGTPPAAAGVPVQPKVGSQPAVPESWLRLLDPETLSLAENIDRLAGDADLA